MEYQKYIEAIEKNWPPEQYTMLREALEVAIKSMQVLQELGNLDIETEKLTELLNRKPNRWGNLSIKEFERDIALLQKTCREFVDKIND